MTSVTKTIHPKTLVVVTGPTAGGKTGLAIDLALSLNARIISADSRQIYRGTEIITAAPTADQLRKVRHYLVSELDLHAYYSASLFERDVNRILLPELWRHSDFAVMCGGSMMYIDAVTDGLDDIPTVSPEIRGHVLSLYNKGGIGEIRSLLAIHDPVYLEGADPDNPRRLIHALEISMQSGRPYSSMLTRSRVSRPYNIVKLVIDMPREQLFDRINRRVDEMIALGAERQARELLPLRHLNSLNTVGFKELFACFDGLMDRQTAIARMAKNTRVYAKKQLTWLARGNSSIPAVRLDATSSVPLLTQALGAIDSQLKSSY